MLELGVLEFQYWRAADVRVIAVVDATMRPTDYSVLQWLFLVC
jgi:hypothetical protein